MAATTTTTTTWIFIATTLLLLLSLPSNGQSPPAGAPTVPSGATAPSRGGLDCMNALINTSDCLSYITAGSKLTKPDKLCCPELAGLVESQPICLCQLLGNPGAFGLEIDLKKAIKLHHVCKVSTRPVSHCAELGVPVKIPSPGVSPASEPIASFSPPSLHLLLRNYLRLHPRHRRYPHRLRRRHHHHRHKKME